MSIIYNNFVNFGFIKENSGSHKDCNAHRPQVAEFSRSMNKL